MAERSRRQVKTNIDLQRIILKQKERSQMCQIRRILKKPSSERSEEEFKILDSVPDLVAHVQDSIRKHKCLKERVKEVNDDPQVLLEKCIQLAKALKDSKNTVVYTGAGISTSAKIPDYRGPDGVWTLLQKGKDINFQDLSLAEPTYTHMALKQLHKEGLISHVVSQNCDGLHLRSGLPKNSLSELHGNMFIEVCTKCKPIKQYIRLFDVTERTGLHRHKTGRFCNKCGTELKDTIVHFGEKGTYQWPMNWKGAVKAASKAELILCLGTSLKVLRRYPDLWLSTKPHNKRPKLYIVNLQWTPKDNQSTLKIHGKCDEIMKMVMSHLGIIVPTYQKEKDPLIQMALPLTPEEINTTTRLSLSKQTICPLSQPETSRNAQNTCDDKMDMQNNISALEKIDSKIELSMQLNFVKCETMQPYVKLFDIECTNVLNDLKAHKIDPWTYCVKNEEKSMLDKPLTDFSGWYGKGCAKWKKHKKKSNIIYKKGQSEPTD